MLSLDAADMSGVHNTDFASNGEVHKVRPRSQRRASHDAWRHAECGSSAVAVRSALPRLSSSGVGPGCRSSRLAALAAAGALAERVYVLVHTPEVSGAGLAWLYHTWRALRRLDNGFAAFAWDIPLRRWVYYRSDLAEP